MKFYQLLARNTNDREVLNRLADDADLEVKYYVAINPYTSADTLDKLAKEKDIRIKEAVSGNKNVSEKTLKKLSYEINILLPVKNFINFNFKKFIFKNTKK